MNGLSAGSLLYLVEIAVFCWSKVQYVFFLFLSSLSSPDDASVEVEAAVSTPAKPHPLPSRSVAHYRSSFVSQHHRAVGR